MLARIIENQEEILFELKVIKDKVGKIENRLNDLEQKMDKSFDITNDKAFKENKLEYGGHFSISSSEDETSKEDRDETSKEDRDKSDDNDSENDNTEQGSKRKNNSNYFNKQNISKGCDFTNLILKITELEDLDPEEVQEAPDEDVDKEKETDNYEKNTDNDE
ncbi:hypothetical protein C2G38_2200606 [Gigaspora rosea]|uniref:Uncharacterized protein n=1 Tax=Gigaspora rosea TaxID=44941 RepID=A0A397UQI0_9GLOM|nr:hypothetical protein C2G38_2200606 [Gigaspora rosea]